MPSSNNRNLNVSIVALENKNILLVNPIRIAREINNCLGKVKSVTKERNKFLLITCKNAHQVQKLLEVTNFGGMEVKVTHSMEPPTRNMSRGVLHRVGTDLSEDELLDYLKDQNVYKIRRFKKKIDGNLQDTRSILLFFNSPKLPETVRLGYEIYKVDAYTPPALRCFKCQQMGHTQHTCKRNVKCVRCGGPHTYEQCDKKDTKQCARCSGNHSAAYKGCPMYKLAQQIQSTKFKEGLSYKEALLKCQASKRGDVNTPENNVTTIQSDRENAPMETPPTIVHTPASKKKVQSKATPTPTVTQEKITESPNLQSKTPEDSTLPIQFDFTKFLSFIVFIITNLDLQTTESNKAEFVINAARTFFNIQSETTENIRELLTVTSV